MRMARTLGMMCLLIIIAGMVESVAADDILDGNETVNTTVTLTQNDSSYLNLSNKMWGFYNEDLIFTSNVISNYVNKNISNQEAMQSMASAFLLNSQATSLFSRITPPDGYSEYHNNTVMALISLQGYMLNLAKFYETNSTGYARTAQGLFNQTIMYHDKAIEDSILR